jgi:hypothetical protein
MKSGEFISGSKPYYSSAYNNNVEFLVHKSIDKCIKYTV